MLKEFEIHIIFYAEAENISDAIKCADEIVELITKFARETRASGVDAKLALIKDADIINVELVEE